MKRISVVLFLAACLSRSCDRRKLHLLQLQRPPASFAPVKDPVTAGLRMLLPRSRNNTLGAITAMPADKFNYKPTPDQMSFAHLVVHIVGFNNCLRQSRRHCRAESRRTEGNRFQR